MKFKVGDRVRIVKPLRQCPNGVGWVSDMEHYRGNTVDISTNTPLRNAEQDGYTCSGIRVHGWHFCDHMLELIEPSARTLRVDIDPLYQQMLSEVGSYQCKPWFYESISGIYPLIPSVNKPNQSITMKITNAFKKFLSPDLQAQVKAGFRDDGLNLTEAGKVAAIEALLDATPAAQTALVAAANEIVAEQK